MRVFDKFLIDGEWVAPDGRGHFDVTDASTEEVIGRVPDGSPADVDRAVAAARRAFEPWALSEPAFRAEVLRQLADGIRKRRDELVSVIIAELGAPRPMTEQFMVDFPANTLQFYAELLATFPFEERIGNSLVVKEPAGVVAAITPWNYPLHQIVAKLGPALAAGCAVVLKPSEVVPLSCFMLAEIASRTALPKGVFNFLSGAGPVVGEAMVTHPGVDMVSFTGSTAAGRRVAELAAKTVKKVSLELGGKSASVILDDADFEKAVRASLNHAFINSGQTCASWTRMLVPRARQEEAVALAADELARSNAIGDPREGRARLGPLVSARQRERVRDYIRSGIAQGARLVAGGADAPAAFPRGYYVEPTLFADVRSDMKIAQEEIFGPVCTILPYDDEDDAVRIANDTIYGLGGAVWSRDLSRARRIARRVRTAQLDINGAPFNPFAPFGGVKQSGNGRELGRYGLEEYLEPKSLQLP
ncbi:MAG TPA: aldehyde dehydrogenase family protein [Myxococcota bacterium]|nr:aldehyde dehydrogenase family protein [Myxococcota bacterium]